MLGAAPDDLDAVIPETLEKLDESELFRLAVVQRDHDGPKRALEAGLLEQQLDDLPRLGTPFQLQYEPEPVPVRLVTDVGEVHNAAFSRKIGDLPDDTSLGDRIGKLGHHELAPPPPQRLLHDTGTHDYAAPPGLVHVTNSVTPDYESTCRKVRPRKVLHQDIECWIRLLNQSPQGGGDLPQVVGWHVRAQPHGDPRGPVNQKVRHPGRENGRLGSLPIEILDDVHRFLFDVREDVLGNRRKFGFRVPVSRRGVTVDGSEVPLPVHERITKGKVLDHTHERVVHGCITMRVILAQDLTHHSCTLLVKPVRPQPRLVHGEEDAPVDGLEPVPNIGQGPLDDHAHRIVKEGFSHLLLDEPRQDALARLGRHSISR